MEQRRRCWRRPAAWLRTLRCAVGAAPSLLVVGVLAVVIAAALTVGGTATPRSSVPAAAPTGTTLVDDATGRVAVAADLAAPGTQALLTSDLVTGPDEPAPVVPELDAGRRELAPFVAAGPGQVEVQPPDVLVRDGEVDLDALAGPLAGATHAAPAAGLTARTPDGDDHRSVDVLGVDGDSIRPLTPEVTAAADGVWDRFAEGDALVTHELADQLGLELGGSLLLRTDTATVPVRIGAFAANGAPAIADVLVPVDVAAILGTDEPNALVVAAGDDAHALGDALAEATGGQVEVRREPAAPVAEERTTTSTPSGRIEPFSYTSRADGRITIHGDWVARHITRVQLPGMAATSCHRAMVPQLLAAVEELIERGLYGHLDPSQFAGCFVARHIDWDPGRPLSMHAWGLAIDFNTRENPLGAVPVMDRRVVEVFERWGFDWGGHWRRPDGMHFELARIVPIG